ncbi:hypothetical protein Y1Q_0004195 [Alligator mississippiensis]|uniref:Uncharacterized protein n=1 Tax=Alligator mississippiensis TaxID=8496 RepID=A0A151PIG6_ALLMI|nr:hypothetical protein Y1Q_0004195 [Alligator mississippiensis]
MKIMVYSIESHQTSRKSLLPPLLNQLYDSLWQPKVTNHYKDQAICHTLQMPSMAFSGTLRALPALIMSIVPLQEVDDTETKSVLGLPLDTCAGKRVK